MRITSFGRSPGLGQWLWEKTGGCGCEFKSQQRILDGHFFAIICCKICIISVENTKNKPKGGQGWPTFRGITSWQWRKRVREKSHSLPDNVFKNSCHFWVFLNMFQVRDGISGFKTFSLSTSYRSRPRRRRLLQIHERLHTGTNTNKTFFAGGQSNNFSMIVIDNSRVILYAIF